MPLHCAAIVVGTCTVNVVCTPFELLAVGAALSLSLRLPSLLLPLLFPWPLRAGRVLKAISNDPIRAASIAIVVIVVVFLPG